MKPRIFVAALITLMGLPLVLSARGASPPSRENSVGDEFFIISSVDAKQKQIVLKRPTEVTQVVKVDKGTVFLNSDGKPIPFSALRAGDTGYVVLKHDPKDGNVVARIRLGPMTLEEVHKRYLNFSTE